MSEPVYVAFHHGLGDCANFAHQVLLYRRRGVDMVVVCAENKRAFFEAVGIPTQLRTENIAARPHPWYEPNRHRVLEPDDFLAENKIWRNFCSPPLPPPPEDTTALWDEYLETRDLSAFKSHAERVAPIVSDLQRPLVLIHAQGNTSAAEKNMSRDMARDIARVLLSNTTGSVVFLDWDHRTSWFHSARTRHILYHYDRKLIGSDALIGLIGLADLMIGIDSGPYHLAGMIDAPSLGVWFGHNPANYAIPRKNCVNIVRGLSALNTASAHIYNIVQQSDITPEYVANAAQLMLSPPRWVETNQAHDVQLQLCAKKCDGGIVGVSHVSNVLVDRHLSFGIVFDYLAARCRPPFIVETGCIRADNDWAGAGYSTFLFGLFVQRLNGRLLSIDLNRTHISYAARTCQNLPAVTTKCADSLVALREITEPVDMFYLDSMDTYVAGHEEHGLAEAQICADKVAPGGLIVFDDTLYEGAVCRGKGAKAVPWLLNNGWRILFAGHQVVLTR